MDAGNDNQPQNPDALWKYWFDLKTAARAKQWDVLRHQLAYAPDKPLAAHPFVTETFHAAANAGQDDILETLFERGFSLDAETLGETIKRVAIHYTADAPGIVRAIRAHKPEASVDDAVCTAAAKGRLDALQALDAAGADVRAGDSGFFVALYSAQPAVMHFLHEKGAQLYHPAMIAAQYGRRGELPAEKSAIAIDVYHELLAADNEAAAVLYAASGPAPKNVTELRENVAGEGAQMFTRLQLAVRAGRWDDVLGAAKADTKQNLQADDFLMPDGGGQRAFDVLAAQGKLSSLFDAALWYRAPQEIEKIYAVTADFRAAAVCDFPALVAGMHRAQIDDIAPAADSFRLTRRRKP
ncbi:MAG: hypothetical protein H3C49_00090 [Alphaproteobacteria bacterium]|nr:hypothetical protein [Alphaproteobacteria bacterium]